MPAPQYCNIIASGTNLKVAHRHTLELYTASAHLPLSPQDVFLHPFLGQLLGFHILGVLFKPGVLKTLLTGETSPK